MKSILLNRGNSSFVRKMKSSIKTKIAGLIIIAFASVFIAGCDNNNAANKAAADKRYNDSVSQSINRSEGEHEGEGHGMQGNERDSMMKGHKEQH